MRQAPDGKAAVTLLVNFLTSQGVTDQLLAWRDQALDRQDVRAAAEPEQTWQTFCGMLDEYVTILGAEPFEITDFWHYYKRALKVLVTRKFRRRWTRC